MTSPSSLDAYKFTVPSQPLRGPKAHKPVECVEVYGHPWQRVFQCPACKKGYELDEESNAIGFTCFGDAAMEASDER